MCVWSWWSVMNPKTISRNWAYGQNLRTFGTAAIIILTFHWLRLAVGLRVTAVDCSRIYFETLYAFGRGGSKCQNDGLLGLSLESREEMKISRTNLVLGVIVMTVAWCSCVPVLLNLFLITLWLVRKTVEPLAPPTVFKKAPRMCPVTSLTQICRSLLMFWLLPVSPLN